jgi:hypothetical protein
VSGRMNWDRVNRENRAWREAGRAPSGNWEPYDSPEVDRRPRTEAKRRRPKTEDKAPTIPRVMGTSKAARQRRPRWETGRHRGPADAAKAVMMATAELQSAATADGRETGPKTKAKAKTRPATAATVTAQPRCRPLAAWAPRG